MFWMNLPGNSAVMGSHLSGRSGKLDSLSATAGRANGSSMSVTERSCQELAAAGERRRGSHRLQARVILRKSASDMAPVLGSMTMLWASSATINAELICGSGPDMAGHVVRT